jgi:D-tyrosyl-tRNA(Tyr) deacylase
MRAVVQRVLSASVEVDGQVVSAIQSGLLVYLGVGLDDTPQDAAFLADKVRYLRIFEDQAGKMNLDVAQSLGSVLVVSAFTVQADARKGRRPTFDFAAPGESAVVLYEAFCDALGTLGVGVFRGVFATYMRIQSVNDGPVCILLDSKRSF